MTTTVWLSPSATAFSCLCEPCLRRLGVVARCSPTPSSPRASAVASDADTALGVVRCAAGHEIVLRRGERPPALASRDERQLQLV